MQAPETNTTDQATRPDGTSPPEIYVVSLADYASGLAHGRWIRCDLGAEWVKQQIDGLLARSPYAAMYGDPAEEWAIHGSMNFFGIEIAEQESIKAVCELVENIKTHGEPYAAYVRETFNRDVNHFQRVYICITESQEDFANQLADETILPTLPPGFCYFDYEAHARTIFINDYFSVDLSNNRIAVFSTR